MLNRILSSLGSTLTRSIVLLLAAFLLVTVFVNRVNATEAQFIVNNESSADVSAIKLKRVEYVGQCPGTVISPGSVSAKFISKSVSPGNKRRVIIRNISDGMNNNPYPYTDRAYNQGQYSEGFNFSIANSHKNQTFSILEGSNKFEYEIKEEDKVIEKGNFTAEVSVRDLGTFPREAICEEKSTCRNDGDCYYKDGRRRGSYQRCYPVTTCRCP